MSELKVKDFVGISRTTFSATYRNAIEQAKDNGGTIEGIEVGPPFHVVLAEDGEVEYRSIVRVTYRDDA